MRHLHTGEVGEVGEVDEGSQRGSLRGLTIHSDRACFTAQGPRSRNRTWVGRTGSENWTRVERGSGGSGGVRVLRGYNPNNPNNPNKGSARLGYPRGPLHSALTKPGGTRGRRPRERKATGERGFEVRMCTS
jgi:hypothetical protein